MNRKYADSARKPVTAGGTRMPEAADGVPAPEKESVRFRVRPSFCGETLLEAMRRERLFIETPCGGNGTCGKCRVRVWSGRLSDPSEEERRSLTEKELRDGFRLACAARFADAVTEVEGELPASADVYLADGFLPAVRPDAGLTGYGIACDLGTTTVVCTLVDLAAGTRAASRSAVNRQAAYGLDVLTRIGYEIERGETAVRELQNAAAETLNGLIGQLCRGCGVPPSQIKRIHVAGNCTMLHMLLGEDARGIGRAPYRPRFLASQRRSAASVGIDAAPQAELCCLPGASAFVGADVVAGICACGLPKSGGTVLFLDIGTNGEIVLKTGNGLFGCSCAAGPALEGMNIRCGMRASAGAVEDVRISEDGVFLQVIGEGRPEGICGSGILSLLKELIRNGLIRPNGTLAASETLPKGDLRKELLITEANGKRAILLDRKSGLTVTQEDLRQVQLAKGAILSGIRLLLAEAGVSAEELDRVLVAGQFGAHLSPDALTVCGILPRRVEGKIEYVGNTSGSGAYLSLISEEFRLETEAAAERIQSLDLSRAEGYARLFAECLSFRTE